MTIADGFAFGIGLFGSAVVIVSITAVVVYGIEFIRGCLDL